MKKTIYLLIFFWSFSIPCSGATTFNFEPFWTLKTETGQSIDISKIDFDTDNNYQPLWIYTDTNGKEGIIDQSNIANIEELSDLIKGVLSENEKTTPKEEETAKTASTPSETIIENTWHKNDTTYVLVTYTNKTQQTFNSGVTITCATKDKNGKMINTNHRSFFAHEYGPISPGFSDSVKIPISDIPETSTKDISCSFNEW